MLSDFKISVIIPTYNRASEIQTAIDSVINQTVRPFEIIVVDDGSTDNTKEIIKNKYPEVIYLYQKNRGPAVARNKGIKHASGNFIDFLDSDDIWGKNKISREIEALEKNAGINIIVSKLAKINNNGFIVFRKPYPKNGKLSVRSFYTNPIKNFFFYLDCCTIRKDALLRVGCFDTNRIIGEDVDLFFKLFTFSEFYLIDQICAFYSDSKHSITKDMNNNLYCSITDHNFWGGFEEYTFLQSSKNILFSYNTSLLKKLYLILGLGNCYLNLAKKYFIRKNYRNVTKYLLLSIILNPFSTIRLLFLKRKDL